MRKQSAQESASAHVDAGEAVAALHKRQLDLVRPDETGAVDVDQLAVEHILAQENLLLVTSEVIEIEATRAKRDCLWADRLDLGGGDEDRTAGYVGERAGERRIVVTVKAHDQVDHAPEPLTAAVTQRAGNDQAQVEVVHLALSLGF